MRFCNSVYFWWHCKSLIYIHAEIRELIRHLSPCHLSSVHATETPVRHKCVLCPLKFNINIYINLCISSSSSGSGSYNHCIPFAWQIFAFVFRCSIIAVLLNCKIFAFYLISRDSNEKNSQKKKTKLKQMSPEHSERKEANREV